MGRYTPLHDNRVHSDDVEKKPPEGFRDGASCERADEEREARAEEAKYRHVGGGGGGGGSGRLGAAVQRAMAMRERQSTHAGEVKGIGAMRQLCNIHTTVSAPPAAEMKWSTTEKEPRQIFNVIVSPPPGIRSQSMRYSRFFCPEPDEEEDHYRSLNKPPGLGNHITSSLPQSPLPQRSANAPPKKKGFLRELFRLRKKSASACTS